MGIPPLGGNTHLLKTTLSMDIVVERVDLSQVQFTTELLRTVPASVARRFLLVPISLGAGSLVVAVPDASRPGLLHDIALAMGRDVELRIADRELLLYYVNRFYDDKETL